MEDKLVRLRFLAGPHLGAELSLPPGEHLLGSTDECTLIVCDPLPEPCAVKVTVKDDLTLACEQISGAVFLDGKPLQGGPVPWDKAQILALGFAALALFDEETRFEDLNLKALGLASLVEEKSDQEEPSQEQKSASAPASSEQTPENGAALKSDVQAVPAGRGSLIFAVCGLFLLLMLLSSLVAGSYLYGRGAKERHSLSLAQSYIEQGQYDAVKAQIADGAVLFSGTLPDKAALQRFVSHLPQLQMPAVFDVTLYDSTLTALMRSFAVQGATVSAEYSLDDEDPAIILRGYVKDLYVLRYLMENSLAGMTSLPPIRPQFCIQEDLTQILVDLRGKYRLPLEFDYADFDVLYEGRLTYEESLNLEKLQSDAVRRSGCPLSFKDKRFATPQLVARINRANTVSMTASDADAEGGAFAGGQGRGGAGSGDNVLAGLLGGNAQGQAAGTGTDNARGYGAGTGTNAGNARTAFDPLAVTAVTLHPLRFVTMRSGEKYFEGAMLPGGSLLKEIALDHLVLVNAGEERRYELR